MNVKQLIYKTLTENGCNVDENKIYGMVTVTDEDGVKWCFTAPVLIPIFLTKQVD